MLLLSLFGLGKEFFQLLFRSMYKVLCEQRLLGARFYSINLFKHHHHTLESPEAMATHGPVHGSEVSTFTKTRQQSRSLHRRPSCFVTSGLWSS